METPFALVNGTFTTETVSDSTENAPDPPPHPSVSDSPALPSGLTADAQNFVSGRDAETSEFFRLPLPPSSGEILADTLARSSRRSLPGDDETPLEAVARAFGLPPSRIAERLHDRP